MFKLLKHFGLCVRKVQYKRIFHIEYPYWYFEIDRVEAGTRWTAQ